MSEPRRTRNGDVAHPAKYSEPIITELQNIVHQYAITHPDKETIRVLDFFGGVGYIFRVTRDDQRFWTTVVEIEEEWADQSLVERFRQGAYGNVIHANFFKWVLLQQQMGREWDIICVSPTYGNRMADDHQPSPEDTSRRNTYRHTLGRPLTEGTSANLQWTQDEYRDFHERAWKAVRTILAPDGIFILNIKDHIRGGKKQPVVAWHKARCKALGFRLAEDRFVPTKGNGQGQNGDARTDGEYILIFDAPEQNFTKRVNKKDIRQPMIAGTE